MRKALKAGWWMLAPAMLALLAACSSVTVVDRRTWNIDKPPQRVYEALTRRCGVAPWESDQGLLGSDPMGNRISQSMGLGMKLRGEFDTASNTALFTYFGVDREGIASAEQATTRVLGVELVVSPTAQGSRVDVRSSGAELNPLQRVLQGELLKRLPGDVDQVLRDARFAELTGLFKCPAG